MSKEPKCTLSNDELISSCNDWVTKLNKSGGQAWTLRVPPDLNYDPDMLICEMGIRLKKQDFALDSLRAEIADLQATIAILREPLKANKA